MPTTALSAYIRQYHDRYFPAYPLTEIQQCGERVVGKFFNCSLSSFFQPVLRAEDHQIVGHEAFVRCGSDSDSAISPWSVFSLAASARALVQLDRLCRTVHMLNYFSVPREELLFVNVHQGLLASVKQDYGRVFEEIIGHFGVQPHQIVIELPGAACFDPELLDRVIASYRARGYKVAVNHVSSADAWLEALGDLVPDIVKVDPASLAYGQQLHELVDRLHGAGAWVLAKKIQSADLAASARAAAVDLLQGFYFSVPTPTVVSGQIEAGLPRPKSRECVA